MKSLSWFENFIVQFHKNRILVLVLASNPDLKEIKPEKKNQALEKHQPPDATLLVWLGASTAVVAGACYLQGSPIALAGLTEDWGRPSELIELESAVSRDMSESRDIFGHL